MENPRYEMIVWWSEEDEAFVVDVPELPGCMAHGNTRSGDRQRANLGRQARVDWSSSDKTSSAGEARRVSAGSANQFHQFVTPDSGRKFTELAA